MIRPGDRRLMPARIQGRRDAQALQYSSRPPMMFGQASFNQPPCTGLFCRSPCRALLPRFSRNGPADRGVEPDGSQRDLQRIELAGTPLRAGIIGLDTSHVTVFTQLMPMALAISRSIIPTFSGTGSTGSSALHHHAILAFPI